MKLFGLKSSLFVSALAAGFVACSNDGGDDVAGGVTDIGNSIAVTGSVVNSSGEPVASARVVAYYDNWEQTEIVDSVVVETDDNGEFEIQVDSGKAFVLYAAYKEQCGLANVMGESEVYSAPANPWQISIGDVRNLKSSIMGQSSGYMRVVGSNATAEVSEDGGFEFSRMPPGDISLVYVNDDKSQGHLDFETVGNDREITIPSLQKVDGNKSWLTVSDYHYYGNQAFGGINLFYPSFIVVPTQKSAEPETSDTTDASTYEVTVPESDSALYGMVFPIKVSTKNFNRDNGLTVTLDNKELAFDIENWGDDALIWVRVDTVAAAGGVLKFTVANEKSDKQNTLKGGTTMFALHMNGDAVVRGLDSVGTEVKDSKGAFGDGLTLKQGQFIDLDSTDIYSGDFTLSMWTKWDGPNGQRQILFSERDQWSDSTSRFQWYFEVLSGLFTTVKSDFYYPIDIYGDSTIVPFGGDSEWSFLTLVCKARKLTMFVNGVEVGWKDPFSDNIPQYEIPQYNNPNETQTFMPFRLGGTDNRMETWNGSIDEVRVETVAHDAAWVKATYQVLKEAIK